MFLLGVAEQFAIAEAKLRAWASVDEDDEEDSNDEDSHNTGHTHTFPRQSSGIQKCQYFVHLISSHFHHHHFFFIPASSLTNHLIFPASPSPGDLTLCSPLRRRHMQFCFRSATPAWFWLWWNPDLRQPPPDQQQQQLALWQTCVCQWSKFLPDQFTYFTRRLHEPIPGGGRGKAGWAAGSCSGPVQWGLRPSQARVEASGEEQQVRLLLLHLSLRVPWRGGRGGWGRGWQRVSRGSGVALQPEELLLRPGFIWSGIVRWRGGGEGWSRGEKRRERVFDVMCCPSLSLWICVDSGCGIICSAFTVKLSPPPPLFIPHLMSCTRLLISLIFQALLVLISLHRSPSL